MSNIYHFTPCEHCNRLTCSSQQGDFFVRGSFALDKLHALIEMKASAEEIAAAFCSNCGSVMEGGCCDQPTPQELRRSV